MAEAEQQNRTHGSDPPYHLKLLSFVSSFLKPKSLAYVNDSVDPKPTGVVSAGNNETQNSSVSFPYHRPNNTEPLKFQAEGSTSNPFVLWQVCAVGGFLALKWAWTKWNESNEISDKKKTTDDGDDQAPHKEGEDDHSHKRED